MDIYPEITVGTLVTAKRWGGVCSEGERGVCYEVYTLGNRLGYGILFEQGKYDGFSPSEVELVLEVHPVTAASIEGYQFENVGKLSQDYLAGQFKEAFQKAAPA